MATANFVTDLTEIFTQVAEAAAGIGSLIAGFKTVSLARKYYDLYREQRDYYYNTFQNGVELPLVNDIYNIPIYLKDYAGRAGTIYDPVTGPFGGQSGNIENWLARHAKMYATTADEKITELEPDKARLQSDWTNYLFRFEEVWADTRNDIRWGQRLMVHNIGLKQGTAVTSSLNSSLGEYQDHLRDLSSQLATYGNGIAKYAGYKKGLSDTSDDFAKATSFRDNSVTVEFGHEVITRPAPETRRRLIGPR